MRSQSRVSLKPVASMAESGSIIIMLLIAVLALAVVSAAFVYVGRFKGNEPLRQQTATGSQAEATVTADRPTSVRDGWTSHEDHTLGLRFAYPTVWGEPSLVHEDARSISYTIGNVDVSALAASVKAEGDGVTTGAMQGFRKVAEGYVGAVSGQPLAGAVSTLQLLDSGAGVEVLLQEGTIEHELWGGAPGDTSNYIQALINLRGAVFPGVAIAWNGGDYRRSSDLEYAAALQEFRELLETVETFEPSS